MKGSDGGGIIDPPPNHPPLASLKYLISNKNKSKKIQTETKSKNKIKIKIKNEIKRQKNLSLEL